MTAHTGGCMPLGPHATAMMPISANGMVPTTTQPRRMVITPVANAHSNPQIHGITDGPTYDDAGGASVSRSRHATTGCMTRN